MISLILSFLVLIAGYFIYGKIVEKTFAPDGRETPAYAKQDGVDFIPMPTWKAFLVQLLNIAGTGPIFGALMGACFGPVVFLWIIFGAVLGGGVHDYMSGMISERHDGASIAELSGIYLGPAAKWIMRVFSILLLLLTGTVFVNSPAALLARLTPDSLNVTFWIAVILAYYILATLLPIDKIIGKLYPVFGAVLIIMAVGIIGGVIAGGYTIPELSLHSLHPNSLPVWPFMFVTVACGAISGFHATQSPMVAKCIKSEKQGRRVFYGAMLSESVIALVWAAGGVAFYGTTGGLSRALADLGQSGAVYDISTGMLGPVGGVLAVVGVIACPITSGDTAFRSARLILAEITKLDQKRIGSRLIITVPLLAAGAVLTQLDFNVLWRYFSWSNQTLAMISLWIASAYLLKTRKNRISSLLTALPAAFMSAVSMTYILMAPEGFGLGAHIGYPAGIVFAAALFAAFLAVMKGKNHIPGSGGAKNERTGQSVSNMKM
ncbi:MAG: carbon starvation protein A [Oscillospiraceae bacterium]|nr:carbon starvation protein A [Oscillospiraceae bacterium]